MPKKVNAAVIVFAVTAALLFPISFINNEVIATNGSSTSCQPSTTCQIGEFLFDDSYVPITTATCTLTSKYPDGTAFLSSVALTAAADGWYSYEFTTPATTGIYRTLLTCVTGSDTLSLDKSFNVQTSSTLSESQVSNAVWNAERSSHNSSGSFGQALQNIVPTTGDISSSVWGYTNRTLSSFGTLIADIWKDKSNTQNEIKKTTSENRLLLEKLVNKPIIQNFLEDDTDLDSKLEETKKVTGQLQTNTQYIKSKTILINNRFTSLKVDQIQNTISELSNLVGTEENQSSDNVYGQIDWLTTSWDWKILVQTAQSTKNIQKLLSSAEKELSISGKSRLTSSIIKNISTEATKLDSYVGPKDSTNQTTIWGYINSTVSLTTELNTSSKNIDGLLEQMSQKNNADIEQKTNSIAKEVFLINKIPTAQTILFADNLKTQQTTTNSKTLKNKLLSLKGLITTNKRMLANKPNTPLAGTWLEEGSIVFKSLISNPSLLINQEADVKYYLPQEIKKEDILAIDSGLTVNYDVEKDQSYVQGVISLLPGSSKTLSVKTEDIWKIDEAEITSLKHKADELAKPLEKTSYFAQGVTLKSDINTQLDKVLALNTTKSTPEAKIKGYRESMLELEGVKENLDKLEDLATQASSMGSLKGFIGGAQVFAVWGITIIFITGFVLLAYYLKKQGLFDNVNKKQVLEAKTTTHAPESTQVIGIVPLPTQPKFGFKFKFAAITITLLIIGATSLAFYSIKSSSKKESVKENQGQAQSQTQETKQEILGTKEEKSVKIFVPEDSIVSMHQEPTIASPIVTTFNSTQDAKVLEESDYWLKLKTTASEGWINKDFIDMANAQETSAIKSIVTILQTPTGFLRVRQKPSGTEIAQIQPGDKYPLLSEEEEWVQIKIDNQTNGWISKQYTQTN